MLGPRPCCNQSLILLLRIIFLASLNCVWRSVARFFSLNLAARRHRRRWRHTDARAGMRGSRMVRGVGCRRIEAPVAPCSDHPAFAACLPRYGGFLDAIDDCGRSFQGHRTIHPALERRRTHGKRMTFGIHHWRPRPCSPRTPVCRVGRGVAPGPAPRGSRAAGRHVRRLLRPHRAAARPGALRVDPRRDRPRPAPDTGRRSPVPGRRAHCPGPRPAPDWPAA